MPLPVLDSPRDRARPEDPGEAAGPAADQAAALALRLRDLVADGALVAFSGGVDSAALLCAAAEARDRWGGRLVALTTTSAAVPAADLADAADVARRLGVPHEIRDSAELADPAYRRNDGLRCYHCKQELFRIARAVADEEGLRWLLYGYTASDVGDDRPGHRAALEAGVVSPLAEHGLGKPEVRELLRHRGIALADKPAAPCLASRLQTAVPVTPERLADVAALEEVLHRAGARVARARVCAADRGHFVRIEVDPAEMPAVLGVHRELDRAGRARGYRWVTLDLAGYRTGGGTR